MENSIFISKRAEIGQNVLIGKMVNIFGAVVIGDGTIIEDFVTIGHPSPSEINIDKINNNSNSLHEYYDSLTQNDTFIGQKSIIRSSSVIYSGCNVGQYFDCSHNVLIRENCKIGNNVYILPNVQIKSEVIIGNYCRLAGTICDRTKIGCYSSMLGHTVHVFLIGVGGYKEPAPSIGKGVTVGREAVIVGDVIIDDFSLIGSNSVVTSSIPEKCIFAGIPARKIRIRHEDELKLLKKKINNTESEGK